MHYFVILCLVAVVCADKLGYNYHPVPHSDSGLSFAPGSIGGALGNDNFGLGSIGGGSVGRGLGGPSEANIGDDQHDALSYSSPAELEKEFYTFTAPEEEFNDAQASQQIANSVKQGLRVIFIKSPENRGLENAALALAKHAAEQKTAIYVLSKQADVGDLANKLNAINKNKNNRPDVHFVKYRTSEDAANAQKAIQSQYDSLGGSSQSHNGGVAPVINFASQASTRSATVHAPGNSYLPSSIFRRV